MTARVAVVAPGTPGATPADSGDGGDGGGGWAVRDVRWRLRVALQDPDTARRVADALSRVANGPPAPWPLAPFFAGAARGRRAARRAGT
jgi:hypothetical protein